MPFNDSSATSLSDPPSHLLRRNTPTLVSADAVSSIGTTQATLPSRTRALKSAENSPSGATWVPTKHGQVSGAHFGEVKISTTFRQALRKTGPLTRQPQRNERSPSLTSPFYLSDSPTVDVGEQDPHAMVSGWVVSDLTRQDLVLFTTDSGFEEG